MDKWLKRYGSNRDTVNSLNLDIMCTLFNQITKAEYKALSPDKTIKTLLQKAQEDIANHSPNPNPNDTSNTLEYPYDSSDPAHEETPSEPDNGDGAIDQKVVISVALEALDMLIEEVCMGGWVGLYVCVCVCVCVFICM